MALNLVKAMSAAGDLKRVADILDPANGELRWRLLQAWLAEHPEYHGKLMDCLKLTPAAAVEYLCTEMGLDLDAFSFFDPNGQMRAKVELTIERLQELYRERAAANVPPRRLKPV